MIIFLCLTVAGWCHYVKIYRLTKHGSNGASQTSFDVLNEDDLRTALSGFSFKHEFQQHYTPDRDIGDTW